MMEDDGKLLLESVNYSKSEDGSFLGKRDKEISKSSFLE
jgi:hypothetical protein